MIENKQAGFLLSSKKLANGMQISFYDLSKKMAADRWLIKLKCEAVLFLQEDFFNSIEEVDFISFIKDRCKNGLVFTVFKERTFVDESDKKELLVEMLIQLEKNSLKYLGSELFPERFLDRKLEELKKEFQVKREMDLLDTPEDDVDEPVDFSACFKD